MKDSTKAIRFLQTLEIPQGPKAGQKLKLAPFQRQFVKGALAPEVNTGVMSVGRGAGKSSSVGWSGAWRTTRGMGRSDGA